MNNVRRAAGALPAALRRPLLGLAMIVLATLTACGAPSGAPPSGVPTTSAGPTSTTPSPAAEAPAPAEPTSTPAAPSVDPRSLTGPSSVTVTAAIAPVAQSPSQQLPVTYVDDTGATITIDDASRVLLLDIYSTYSQIAVGLGMEGVIVGRTASDAAPELADLPVVTGDGHDLNAEAILALSPTLVVTDTTLGPPEVAEQLANSGVTVVTMSPERSLDTVERDILAIATVLGVPDTGRQLADAALADIDAASTEIADLAPDVPLRTTTLYVRGTAGIFFIFGSDYGTGALMEAVHAEDAATTAGITGVRPANAESLAQLDPEVIIVMAKGLESTGGLSGLLERPGVGQTTAGLTQRIVDIDDSLLLSFGPNTGNVLRGLAAALYGG